MIKTVPDTEARRNFSRILRDVRNGQTYVITSNGKPIAKIVPTNEDELRREEAWKALFARLENQTLRTIEPWTRDELYGEGQ